MSELNKEAMDLIFTTLDFKDTYKNYIPLPIPNVTTEDIANANYEVWVDLYEPKNIVDDMFHTVLAGASDRNIMVYDPDSKPGELSDYLFSSMETIFHDNYTQDGFFKKEKSYIDYYLIDKKHEHQGLFNRSLYEHKFIFIDMEEYQKYYLNELCGSLAPNKTNLIIGIKNSNSCIKVTSGDRVGVACLDTSDLLLGSF